jgi:hypothetical protein
MSQRRVECSFGEECLKNRNRALARRLSSRGRGQTTSVCWVSLCHLWLWSVEVELLMVLESLMRTVRGRAGRDLGTLGLWGCEDRCPALLHLCVLLA